MPAIYDHHGGFIGKIEAGDGCVVAFDRDRTVGSYSAVTLRFQSLNQGTRARYTESGIMAGQREHDAEQLRGSIALIVKDREAGCLRDAAGRKLFGTLGRDC
jgi:hypothetical protein